MKEKNNDHLSDGTTINRSEPSHEEDTSQTQKLAELFSDSPHLGEIPMPDGYAYIRADCGDSIEVFLAVKNGYIQKARFDTIGCGFTIACGNKAMEMAEGRLISEALKITSDQIISALGEALPVSHYHCAELAVLTLKEAIRDCLVRGKESWKKLYRNH